MLSSKNAHQILRGVCFPGEEKAAQNDKIAGTTKTIRRKLISLPIQTEEGRIAAAVEIQRVWRGFFTRLRLADILEALYQPQVGHQQLVHPAGREPTLWPGSQSPPDHPVSIPSHAETPQEDKDAFVSRTDLSVMTSEKQPLKLRYRYETYLQKAIEHRSGKIISYEEYCAHYIQNWWFKVRRKRSPSQRSISSAYSPKKSVSLILSSSAVTLALKPVIEPVKKKREVPIGAEEAAMMIQRAWRRHIDVQVYRYYRDLINFRCCGNPAVMLRCINPRESTLLDPAAGIHIKFRLAGTKFPPNIYYKIFTHRNIVDMCANSPKDYTAAPVKRKDARDVHGRRKGSGRERQDDRTGWYQRIENNGWRLVSDRLILQADQDPLTNESAKKPQEFHHSKLRRRVDVEKKKRRRKLEWLQKMYQEGVMQARSRNSVNGAVIEGAAAGMLTVMEERGPEAVEDWEVDELLEWTDGLNFDDYLADWQAIATSASSEKHTAGDDLKFDTTQLDPFEFSLSVNNTPPSLGNTSPHLSSTGKRAPMPTPLKSDVIVM